MELFGSQKYCAAPVTCQLAVSPLQIAVSPIRVIVDAGRTVTEILSVVEQPLTSNPETVYVIEVRGNAPGLAQVSQVRVVAGNH